MDSKTLAAALKLTLPVLAGYLAIGIAFGLMLSAAGYGAGWAALMSVFIYAGSGQYLGVELLSTGATLLRVALMTLLVNFRHVVYGLSMLEKFRGMGPRKLYMIFALTDETYALLGGAEPPEGLSPKRLYFYIAVLDHLYWILGTLIGSVAGALIKFSTKGVEFAMTALFILIAVEQWKSSKTHIPAIIGACGTIAPLIIFGSANMLIPALVIITALLVLLRRRLDTFS